jgi:ATP-binding protein involved in chromosome partitioning
MRIAVPVADGVLCAHFGHCTHFALFDVDHDNRTVTERQDLPAPEHQPGLFPAWLSGEGVNVVLSGGMGSRARELLAANGITVVVGAVSDDPGAVVADYLAQTLATSPNFCDK